MPTTRYCRSRNKNVRIDQLLYYVCADSAPLADMDTCENYKCVYHMAMPSAAHMRDVLGSGPGSAEDVKQVAIMQLGAIDYCD